ncbi:MAG: hypothetical protein WC624_02220 [Candidatus Margulisiibacteriota bacterium]
MAGYEEYLEKLKDVKAGFDEKKLYSRIESGISRRSYKPQLAMAGALAVLIFSIFYYNSHFYTPGDGGTLADYVYQQNEPNSDPVMDYVLADQ